MSKIFVASLVGLVIGVFIMTYACFYLASGPVAIVGITFMVVAFVTAILMDGRI